MPRRSPGKGRLYFDASKDRWVAAVTVDGRVTKRLYRTEPEGEAGLKTLLAQAEAQQLALSNQTLDQFIAEWLTDHVVVNRSARTYEAYRGKLAKHVSPHLGSKRLRDLEPKHVRQLYQKLRDDGGWTRHKDPKRRPLSPNTIANVHVILHSALTWAVRDGRIPSNPLDRVHAPQKVEYEPTTFEEEQVPILLAAIREHRYEHLWRFQLATGTRHGEATGLRREDVDRARMVARIWEAIAYLPSAVRDAPASDGPLIWWERKRTKTQRSRRTTPLSLPAMRAIEAGIRQADSLQEAAGPAWFTGEPGLIFPDDDGRPLRENKVLRAWDAMLAHAKLPDCRPHDLRHAAAELALEHGAALIDVSRLLGHADAGITDRIYGGKLSRAARRASDRVALAFGEEGETSSDAASGEG